MTDKRIALVTGANQGIGLQIAKDLVAKGLTVLVGSRNLANGEMAARDIGAGAHAIQLDVTGAASIAAAAQRIGAEFGRLDILINNAGISKIGHPQGVVEDIVKNGRISSAPLDDIRTIYETNVFGVIAVTQAMLPLLRKSKAARIVNVSSGVGSLTRTLGPGGEHLRSIYGMYSASKTALNAVTVGLALDLAAEGIKVNAACPGYTKTALNNFMGTRTVEEGAREPVRLALLGDDGPTGSYSNDEGPLPW
ncbi:MAG TPA: SDR family NAD(P)-dependent oxidoreductase [Rhizomicrobium sp.]|jgi:NAD(P)-dependent dehydrogenase (short-subunit alcohol dehydrogenase family)|nr:SDR family NAD(P)-dependent oxidoreductase [Rhizomicrobium sp.]